MLVVLCDDDQVQLAEISGQLKQMDSMRFADVRIYEDSKELCDAIERGTVAPDIAVLDVHMQLSGIDVARALNRMLPHCQVIFMTGDIGMATEVYDVEHAYFVLKSELDKRLGAAIGKAMARIGSREARQLVLNFAGQTTMLPLSDVLYIERTGHRTRVVSIDAEYVTYQPIRQLLEGADGLLVRSHNSYYVNPRHVQSIGAAELILRGGMSVPMSRSFRASARQALMSRAQYGMA